jgi:hypothetical protein
MKFNEEIKVIQKKLMSFQKTNTMTAAQQTNDTVVINKLMMEYNTIQQEVVLPLKQNILLMLKVIKIFYYCVGQGLLMDPTTDVKKNDIYWFR